MSLGSVLSQWWIIVLMKHRPAPVTQRRIFSNLKQPKVWIDPCLMRVHTDYSGRPKAFFIRQVLHDWPDRRCKRNLEHPAVAMNVGYSKFLINDFVVPDVGASDFITAIDLVVMGMSGGMERTKSRWSKLLASAGLCIEKIWMLYDETESVVEVVLDASSVTDGDGMDVMAIKG